MVLSRTLTSAQALESDCLALHLSPTPQATAWYSVSYLLASLNISFLIGKMRLILLSLMADLKCLVWLLVHIKCLNNVTLIIISRNNVCSLICVQRSNCVFFPSWDFPSKVSKHLGNRNCKMSTTYPVTCQMKKLMLTVYISCSKTYLSETLHSYIIKFIEKILYILAT